VRYLPDKKTKLPFALPLSLLADRAQNLSGPAPDDILGVAQISSESVHFGGVIAGRVNIVETRHKVFPILGEASSPSKYYRY